MYARSYPERGTEIPDGYAGSAMQSDDGKTDGSYIDSGRNPWEADPSQSETEVSASAGISPLSGLFGGLFQNGRFNLQSIGVEEILIIAAAAYMLLSQDGDRECGIMLLVLLFIA